MPTLAYRTRAGKRYSQFEVQDQEGGVQHRARVNHERGAIQEYLSQFPQGTPVALESVGNLSAARQVGIG
jgi:hypothetical protein